MNRTLTVPHDEAIKFLSCMSAQVAVLPHATLQRVRPNFMPRF